MQLVVDSLLTNYDIKGSGKTILILPGWGDTLGGMQYLQTALSKQYKVAVLDLPGFGGTQSPAGVWGLDNYAQFVQHFLQKARLETWMIIGHSNGGAIIVRGLARGWLQAERAALLASAGVRGEYKGRLKAIRLITKAGKALVAPLPSTVKKRLRKKVYHTIGSDMLVAEHLQETFKKVVTDDVRADAAMLDLPVLLVYGENDDATPVRYAEQFHELISHSTLEILPGAGHYVHTDRPADVLRAIEEFAR